MKKGWWKLTITGDIDLEESDREHIAECINEGYTEGEIIQEGDMLDDIDHWDKEECESFLRANWGFRGYEGHGITRKEENRTLNNLRAECKSQYIRKQNE